MLRADVVALGGTMKLSGLRRLGLCVGTRPTTYPWEQKERDDLQR